MRTTLRSAATAAFLVTFAIPAIAANTTGHPPQAMAYRFELAGTPKPLNTQQYVVAVRLVRAAETVADAKFSQIRLDMSPDNMADMTAPVSQIASTVPGTYTFAFDKNTWAVKGHWALVLTAKVNGEAQPVNGRVVFQTGQ